MHPPSILITDDDVAFRNTLSDMLAPCGYELTIAGDGAEALDIVQRRPIDLLLCDNHMPRLTGLETIAQLRQIKKALPCILMSAALDDQIMAEAQLLETFSVPDETRHAASTAFDN
jgi:two-component system response regulator (stage 0 sporulation protein F)